MKINDLHICFSHKQYYNYDYGKNQTRTKFGPKIYILEWAQTWANVFLTTEISYVVSENGRQNYLQNKGDYKNVPVINKQVDQTLLGKKHPRLGVSPRIMGKTHNGLFGRRYRAFIFRKGQEKQECGKGCITKQHNKESQRFDIQMFFKRIGTRYKFVGKCSRRVLSPQLYVYKNEKQQELEHRWIEGLIELHYANVFHVCTSVYVPYVLQVIENVLSNQKFQLKCFRIIAHNSNNDGFIYTDFIKADTNVEYLKKKALQIQRKTVIVIDDAKIQHAKYVLRYRKIWMASCRYIFFLPSSPHLNHAKALWRILKDKWIKLDDYKSKDNLFYLTNNDLVNEARILFVNFKFYVA